VGDFSTSELTVDEAVKLMVGGESSWTLEYHWPSGPFSLK